MEFILTNYNNESRHRRSKLPEVRRFRLPCSLSLPAIAYAGEQLRNRWNTKGMMAICSALIFVTLGTWRQTHIRSSSLHSLRNRHLHRYRTLGDVGVSGFSWDRRVHFFGPRCGSLGQRFELQESTGKCSSIADDGHITLCGRVHLCQLVFNSNESSNYFRRSWLVWTSATLGGQAVERQDSGSSSWSRLTNIQRLWLTKSPHFRSCGLVPARS